MIGYPTFVGFAYRRLQYGYYIIALLFPALTIGAYHLLANWGPLRLLTRPESRWFELETDFGVGLRDVDPEVSPLPRFSSYTDSTRSELGPTSRRSLLGQALRLIIPAALVGIEASAATGGTKTTLDGLTLGIASAYVVAVLSIAVGIRNFGLRRKSVGLHFARDATQDVVGDSWSNSISAANGFLALSTVPMFCVVARAATVTVQSPHNLVHYRWLPWSVGLIIIAASGTAWLLWRRYVRDQPDCWGDLEGRVLLWIVGPIWLFILTAYLPGAIGSFDAFDDSQYLAGPQMLFHHGLLPWRDVYLLHGLIEDMFQGAIGFALLGNTRWGGTAGHVMIVQPLQWLFLYALVATFCRNNRWIAGLFILVPTGGLLFISSTRFMLIPLYLILLYSVIRRASWGRCVAFTVILVIGALLTPENAIFVVCTYVVMAVMEATAFRRGERIAIAFRRTIRCVSIGACLVVLWFLLLALFGALSNFLEFYLAFSSNHALWGAYPAQWNLSHQPQVTFEFWAPVVLWLTSLWWAAAKVRTRRKWTPRDWVLVAAASYTVVYFPKALARLDQGHVGEVFMVSMPLLVLLGIEMFMWLEDLMRVALERTPPLLTRSRALYVFTPCVCVATVVFSTGTPYSVAGTFSHAPLRLHASAPAPPPKNLPGLGYSALPTVDVTTIVGLGRLLDQYAGPDTPVLDYANEPGIVEYLLDRVPGTRFYPIAVDQTLRAQKLTVDDLKRSRPRIVIYSATNFGLYNYDGIPQNVRSFLVSRYVLDNYSPIVSFSGQLLLLRNDLIANAPQLPSLPPGTVETQDLYNQAPSCTFGAIPNYFAYPSGLFTTRTLTTNASTMSTPVAMDGWAVDATGSPAKAVFVTTLSGTLIAQATPAIQRPDVAQALKERNALSSGFRVSLAAEQGPFAVWVEEGHGSVQRIQSATPGAPVVTLPSSLPATIELAGTTYRVDPNPARAYVDHVESYSGRLIHVTFPSGTALSSYEWLTVTASGRSLGSSAFFISNSPDAPTNAKLSFNAIGGSPRAEAVMAGSCLQWYGYDSSKGLYLDVYGDSAADSRLQVSLVRAGF